MVEKENKKREIKKEKKLVLALISLTFIFLLIGLASASVSGCNLQLTKCADKTNVKPGDIVLYTLKYVNIGNSTCTGGGVKIQDTLDSNLQYINYSTYILNDSDSQGVSFAWYEIPGFNSTTNTLTWNGHVVSPGEEIRILVRARVLAPQVCGDFQIPNYFRAWSNEENWKNSNTLTISVDYDCPRCGDGIINQANETCDDGDLDNNDGCSSKCKLEVCGDGTINQANETCDDGDLENGDGCSANCTIEQQHYCGDGNVDSGEECDDHNSLNGDGCSSTCEIEFPQCKYNISIRQSYSNSFGTGIAINTSETYNWVSETPALLTQGIHKIRYYVDNNVVNTTNNASITVKLDSNVISSYYQEIGTFHYKTLSIDTSNLLCDSLHNISVLVVSESNQICTPDNACDNFAIRPFLIKCEEQHYCGDGQVDSGEECDLGEENGETCTPAYGGTCTYCSNTCEEIILTDGYCGDRLIQSPQETCDDGNLVNGDGCSSTCQIEQQHYCGDRHIDIGEQCDDGNLIKNDGCSPKCKLEVCGDGIKQLNEECDDGNLVNGDGCTTQCELEYKRPFCGDHIINQLTEQCDDGNLVNGDGCSALCKIEHSGPKCGDGIINQANETCDDGNLVNGDGCSALCRIEQQEPECGDGIKQLNEECDDGNLVNNDGCSANCKTERCGDGIRQTSEQCDDGNTVNTDSCRNNCKTPYCGDGIKDHSEYCDDGNKINGDGCSKTCRFECPNGICNTTIEEFPPEIWQCDNRLVYDDGTRPGRISTDGEPLVERINNYAFEGEQIKWKVLVMDKNGIDQIKDVYVTVNENIEANCKRLIGNQMDPTCNARILEEQLTTFNEETMAYYECILTVEPFDLMYGQEEITVEGEDLNGEKGKMVESETWFLNPIISFGIEGGAVFTNLRAGTTEYSGPVILTNNADNGSGVMLDMFISGTNYYDSSSSGAKCPTTNQLSLNRFSYYATSGAYSTVDDLEIGRNCDDEGYCIVNYGLQFNNPYKFYNRNEIIQVQKVGPYYTSNLLSPGSDMSLIFRVNVPEPCVGNFDSGNIYFWAEAV